MKLKNKWMKKRIIKYCIFLAKCNEETVWHKSQSRIEEEEKTSVFFQS